MSTVSNSGTPNVPATVMTYGHDNVGNDLTMTETINGTAGVTTSHQFDALNRLTNIAHMFLGVILTTPTLPRYANYGVQRQASISKLQDLPY
jgi:hypothetical protein